jgi:hypothetical protein
MPVKHKAIHREGGDKSQVRAFRKAARELGCDESEKRFQETLRALGKRKPPAKKRSER